MTQESFESAESVSWSSEWSLFGGHGKVGSVRISGAGHRESSADSRVAQ
jgi:hypothetical protein